MVVRVRDEQTAVVVLDADGVLEQRVGEGAIGVAPGEETVADQGLELAGREGPAFQIGNGDEIPAQPLGHAGDHAVPQVCRILQEGQKP